MTDEIYRCSECGKIECGGYLNDDEMFICGETDEPARLILVYSTEWRKKR